MKPLVILSMIACALSACETNHFKQHYNSENLQQNAFIQRKSGEKVRVVEALNPDAAVNRYLQNGYVVLGSSRFHGRWCTRNFAAEQAEAVGATVVVTSGVRLSESERQWAMSIPQSNTVHHSGTLHNWSTNNSWNYHGTSTYTTTTTVSGSYVVGHYGQTAVFMAKKNH